MCALFVSLALVHFPVLSLLLLLLFPARKTLIFHEKPKQKQICQKKRRSFKCADGMRAEKEWMEAKKKWHARKQ